MWPFNKKREKPKPNLVQETIGDLISFRDVVESHFGMRYGVIPRISVAYKDNHGVLRYAEFKHSELSALKAENND